MTSHLFVYGEIGSPPVPNNTGSKFYSLEDFRKELDPKASDYIVHISSPGGDVFDGMTMYNLLLNTGKKVTVKIEGLCASIATLIAGAGSTIEMNRTGRFMIHNPHVSGVRGESTDLRNVADQLDKIKTLLVNVYQKRTQLPQEKLWSMYDNETWLDADDAKTMGFVDVVEDSLRAVARIDSAFKTMKTDRKTAIRSALDTINAWFNPKNQMTETLSDGRTVLVLSEDDDWTGKQVTYEDGTPLEPGEYTLASGKKFTVGDGSTIQTVQEPEAPQQDDNMEQNQLKEAQDKLAASEARIKELESSLAQRNEAVEKAEAKFTKFENTATAKIKALEDKFKALDEEPAGNPNPAQKAERQSTETPQSDPMADFFKSELKRKGF